MAGRSGGVAVLGSPVSRAERAPSVRDVPSEQRFVLEQDGGVGELDYEVDGDRLVRTAVSRATDEGLTIVPWCPYARRWLREHPDVADTVNIDWRTPPPNRQ